MRIAKQMPDVKAHSRLASNAGQISSAKPAMSPMAAKPRAKRLRPFMGSRELVDAVYGQADDSSDAPRYA